VVVVYPSEFLLDMDHWAVEFKSIQIARKVMESMSLEEDSHLQDMYHLFRRISKASSLAGRIFEAIVHRLLSKGWQSDKPILQPIRMVSNCCDPPTFSIDPTSQSSSTPDTLLSSLAPVRTGTRALTRVNFTHGLSDVTLDNNKYYTPITPSHPPFDLFTINLDPDQHTVVISVLQITISPSHKGSAEGYPLIRKIMTRVCELLKKADLRATVKVAYFLVCPEGASQHQWQMPVDWGKNVKTHDHRGDAFCIRVPVSSFD